jgi:hypothetical protein
MSYWNNNGKYQKAYDFLFKKLIPPHGAALNALGEALRLVSRAYYRKYNDGDDYDSCVYEGMVPDLSTDSYPFNNEYNELGRELDSLLSETKYEEATNLVLLHIMLSLSSTSNIYNPRSNRLAPIDSLAGRNALKLLDMNSIFINYCGKNEEWLPESLRKEGVKITKVLSEETRKELKCDTVQEFYRESKPIYGEKQSIKVTLSKDNTILSKKFSKIHIEHKRSVKENVKQKKDRQKLIEKRDKKKAKRKVTNFNNTKMFHQYLKDLTVKKRVDYLKNLLNTKTTKDTLVKMVLTTLVNYKEKKVTSKLQRENKTLVVEKLTKGLNEAGEQVLKTLSHYEAEDTIYSNTLSLESTLDKKLDNLLVEILGSSEAVDVLYQKCKGQ